MMQAFFDRAMAFSIADGKVWVRHYQIVDDAVDDADAVVAEGQRIYARKPNMGEHDVTWSQAEYAHLGLQKEYIRYKSVQRLTEAWACLQRAKRAGLFFELDETPLRTNETPSVPLRWVSLGGGPGFELLAVKWFIEKHFPKYALDLVSLDLEASWREAATGLGLRFNTWDVRDGERVFRFDADGDAAADAAEAGDDDDAPAGLADAAAGLGGSGAASSSLTDRVSSARLQSAMHAIRSPAWQATTCHTGAAGARPATSAARTHRPPFLPAPQVR